jgi:hypothetical protein
MEKHMHTGTLGMLALALGLIGAACSDDVTQVGDDSRTVEAGGNGGSAGNGGASGSSGAGGGSATDLSGIWDLQGSVGPSGVPVTGTLAIDATKFVLTIDGVTLSYFANPAPSATYVNARQQQNKVYDVTRSASAVPLGVVPLDVGGTWSITDLSGPGTCNATLTQDAFMGFCRTAHGEPKQIDFPGLNATLNATRTSVLPSAFGALGGIWELTSDGGDQGSCRAVFSDNTLTASCSRTLTALDGAISFTLADDIGTGGSAEGLEMSAVRR